MEFMLSLTLLALLGISGSNAMFTKVCKCCVSIFSLVKYLMTCNLFVEAIVSKCYSIQRRRQSQLQQVDIIAAFLVAGYVGNHLAIICPARHCML